MSFKRLGIKRSDFNGSKKYCWHKFKSLLSKVSKSLSVTFACNSKAFPSVIIEILFESKNYLSIKKKCLYRSEERRVGKECRYRYSPYHQKTKNTKRKKE